MLSAILSKVWLLCVLAGWSLGCLALHEAGRRTVNWGLDRLPSVWCWLIEKLRRWGKGDSMKT